MARIKDLSQATPNKDDVVVIDGGNGVHKVPLGDLAGIVGTTGIAGFHNSIYRGKNITNYYNDGTLYERISSGTFDDLFVGDYFTITITTEFGTESVDVVLAGFDIYLQLVEDHHVVCVTRNPFNTNHKMNPTRTTEGGYADSDMFNNILPKYATAIETALGSGHLKEYEEPICYEVDTDAQNPNAPWLTGAAYDSDWYETKLQLLSEYEIYGSALYGSGPDNARIANSQLPLFSLCPKAKQSTNQYWLRDVASSQGFCVCGGDGNPGYLGASDSFGVRPRFLIG